MTQRQVPRETGSLTGKIVVVTGGATGIGWGIARAFAEARSHVVIGGRRVEKLVEAAESFESQPPIRHHQLDVADRDSVTEFFAWVVDRVGPVDILVNAAGINIVRRTMAGMSAEEWDHVMAINATGAYNAMAAVLPSMRERRSGLIFNISSVSGKRALTLGGVAYCASKFAMTALGTIVGNEEAANGIRVTNIYPGEVETPILDQRPEPVSAERRATMLQPEDFGPIVRAIAELPPRAHVPEIILKPTLQEYV